MRQKTTHMVGGLNLAALNLAARMPHLGENARDLCCRKASKKQARPPQARRPDLARLTRLCFRKRGWSRYVVRRNMSPSSGRSRRNALVPLAACRFGGDDVQRSLPLRHASPQIQQDIHCWNMSTAHMGCVFCRPSCTSFHIFCTVAASSQPACRIFTGSSRSSTHSRNSCCSQ